MNFVIRCAAIAVGLLSLVPALSAQWEPPVGIPAPTFGIEEQAPAFTHYVDNTHPNATDSGNPTGSPAVPRLTVPTPLPAGGVVEVHGGPYSVPISWTSNGTAAEPVFIRGVGEPIFQSSGSALRFFGSYLIVEGLVFDDINLSLRAPIDHFTLRHCEVRNYSPPSNSAAIGVIGEHIVLYDNHIHDNGDPDSPSEIDIHGIKPDTDTNQLWIVDNHIHDNGGDSVQVGNANSAEPWAQSIYIGRNVMHGDRENAVDIKRARDVIVSQNIAFDYQPSNSSSGSGMVFHDQPDRIWVLFNEVFEVSIGIISTGSDGFYVIGNLVHSITDETDPGSLFGSEAMHARATSDILFVANTIWDINKGISVPSGTGPVEFVGNVIGGLTTASHQLAIGNTDLADASTMSHNLLGGEARIRW
ncbi:MAG: right-handed parallel beta-helix repeat-containing protein, partial [Deltaproteobacteria bacterium]|nr:right-handed parallel beta-helix repeat-containing protein [Deltaproteobacteria bacterium]